MAVGYNPRIVTDGLVLALDAGSTKSYPGSGTTWTDLSGNGNNGTLTNMDGANLDSANGGSLTFDGSNEHILFNSRDFGNEITCVFFIKPSSKNSISTLISSKSSTNSLPRGFAFFINTHNSTDRKLIFEVSNNTAFTAVTTDTNVVDFDTWQQVAFSCVRSTGDTKFYKNGVLISSQTISITDWPNSGSFTMGKFQNLSNYYYSGRISNSLLYSRALTAAEIQQNFNALRGRYGI